ncbi:hypothetical protein [Legionella sp. PC997]|uniref:hypothetical protein n=1 Tax=Legionella sp. PC997 TaxID=2755562 RepID=UPI0015F96F1E|nr:hypothetical protein [Legionella sp. PC997]QMT61505.1 hypothetical protein HBNCFIEN_02909 [Legionella sp. PC997]
MSYEKQEKTPLQPVSMYNLLNWSTVYRGYNALVATLVMVQYLTNPDAAAIEYLPDVAIHAFEAIAPNSYNSLGIGGNVARGIQAGFAFFSGNSTIPSVANVVDVFNHGVNVYHRLS